MSNHEIEAALTRRPDFAAPCNGCGYCCLSQVCSMGSITLGLVEEYGERAPGPCPALIREDDGGYACGMVKRPRDYAPGRGGAHDLRRAASILIGAGVGCDDHERRDPPIGDTALGDLQDRFLAAAGGAEAINRALTRWFGVNK